MWRHGSILDSWISLLNFGRDYTVDCRHDTGRSSAIVIYARSRLRTAVRLSSGDPIHRASTRRIGPIEARDRASGRTRSCRLMPESGRDSRHQDRKHPPSIVSKVGRAGRRMPSRQDARCPVSRIQPLSRTDEPAPPADALSIGSIYPTRSAGTKQHGQQPAARIRCTAIMPLTAFEC